MTGVRNEALEISEFIATTFNKTTCHEPGAVILSWLLNFAFKKEVVCLNNRHV